MLPCRQTGIPAPSPELVIHIGIQSEILRVSPWNCKRAGKKIPAQLGGVMIIAHYLRRGRKRIDEEKPNHLVLITELTTSSTDLSNFSASLAETLKISGLLCL